MKTSRTVLAVRIHKENTVCIDLANVQVVSLLLLNLSVE